MHDARVANCEVKIPPAVLLLLLTLLYGCAPAPERELPDRDVFEAALSHFARRQDTYSLAEDGVILVAPSTLSNNEVALDGTDEGRCENLGRFVASFAERNEKSRPTAEFVPDSPRWRIATEKEAEASLYQLDSNTIKTRITASTPAYSSDRSHALVHFWFLWSEHGASAVYVLANDGQGRWAVECNHVEFRL